ncbi:cytoskeleton-associated protein 2-like [Megalops cyprinoides]|uniref:cytoskeleton-associated protein 2-like n=1 Tax=Megalops cyprinoides TaxID=118141 RepID=UPI00186471DD|nr:cytoskeleton-associated protein 2-like [Megalops cyprinoides]
MPVRQCVKKTPVIPEHYWTRMEEEEEAHSLVCTIDRSLDDCIKLLQEGCPSEQVMEVLSRVPIAKKFAKYWICQARLMERSGNLEVLPLFEEAVRVVLEPVDDLRAVVFEIMKKKETALGAVGKEDSLGQEAQETALSTTPVAMSAMIRGEKEGSSVVKYKITATPGGWWSQQESMKLDGQELRFFTPVRRSVRIGRSATRYPAALQEHDPCVASFRDLLAEEEREAGADPNQNSPLYIYRANEALKDQVHIQLF